MVVYFAGSVADNSAFMGAFLCKKTSIPKPEYTIVIDAGHGGRDVK